MRFIIRECSLSDVRGFSCYNPQTEVHGFNSTKLRLFNDCFVIGRRKFLKLFLIFFFQRVPALSFERNFVAIACYHGTSLGFIGHVTDKADIL